MSLNVKDKMGIFIFQQTEARCGHDTSYYSNLEGLPGKKMEKNLLTSNLVHHHHWIHLGVRMEP